MHGSDGSVSQLRIVFNPILCIRGSVKNKKRERAKVSETSHGLASIWPEAWPEDNL